MWSEPVIVVARDLLQDFERRFDELRRELLGAPARAPNEALLGTRSPLADLVDEGDAFVLTAELPGVRKQEIAIDVQDDSIRIRAQSSRSDEKASRSWVRRERASVAYERLLSLPEEVSADQASAKFEDGLLTVRIPKVEPGKRAGHRIEIA